MRKRTEKRCSTCRVRGVDTCEPCKIMRRLLNVIHKRYRVRGNPADMAERVELYRRCVERGIPIFEPPALA